MYVFMSFMYSCMYVCIYVCMYACMHVCMYVSTYVCMYACIYACMHVCMYARTNEPTNRTNTRQNPSFCSSDQTKHALAQSIIPLSAAKSYPAQALLIEHNATQSHTPPTQSKAYLQVIQSLFGPCFGWGVYAWG